MARTYFRGIGTHIATALRSFAVAVCSIAARWCRYAFGWALSVAGRPGYAALAERLPLARLNAAATFRLRAAKRSRPVVMPRWRMCASA